MSQTTSDRVPPSEVRAKAEAWYAQQIETLQRCHGPSWAEHRQWIESYLKKELRQRLIERGWRPKR